MKGSALFAFNILVTLLSWLLYYPGYSIIQSSIFPFVLSKFIPTLVIGLPLSANRR